MIINEAYFGFKFELPVFEDYIPFTLSVAMY